MYFYRSYTNDPAYNLAVEEYFLKQFTSSICFVYQNNSSVIVGKHQNINAEINHPFVYKYKIKVNRRISGGGAVYHDIGNLNIAIINSIRNNKGVDFLAHTNKIRHVLKQFNIKSSLQQKSNLFVSSLKISGNAAHIWKNRVMHHGTLLFNLNVEMLKNSLTDKKAYYQDNAVKSKQAKVVNLCQLGLSDIEAVIATLKQSLQCKDYTLARKQQAEIHKLMTTKYKNIAWNFGYSPNYILKKSLENFTISSIFLSVKKGFITAIHLEGKSAILKNMEKELHEKYHNWGVFLKITRKRGFHKHFQISAKDFVSLFFKSSLLQALLFLYQ